MTPHSLRYANLLLPVQIHGKPPEQVVSVVLDKLAVSLK